MLGIEQIKNDLVMVNSNIIQVYEQSEKNKKDIEILNGNLTAVIQKIGSPNPEVESLKVKIEEQKQLILELKGLVWQVNMKKSPEDDMTETYRSFKQPPKPEDGIIKGYCTTCKKYITLGNVEGVP